MRRTFFITGMIVAVSLAALSLDTISAPAFADTGTNVKIVPVPPKDTTNAGLSEPRLPPRGTRVLPPVHGQPGPGHVHSVPPVVVPAHLARGRRPGVHHVRLKHDLKHDRLANPAGRRERRAAARRLHHLRRHTAHGTYRHRPIRSRRTRRRR